MNIQEFITKTNLELKKYGHRPLMICSDGFEMSVQGSSFHYCSPREDFAMYTTMEIGFPTEEEELIAEFAENKNDLTGTVYSNVDVYIIQAVIEKHGGINKTETFKINS